MFWSNDIVMPHGQYKWFIQSSILNMLQRSYCNVANKGLATHITYSLLNSKQISRTVWESGSEEGVEVWFESTYIAI